MSDRETPDFGKNQMPPELASQLLSRVTAMRPSVEQVEALDVLREECAEAIQRATKMTRFGVDSVQPSTGRPNTDTLAEELGHVLAAIDLCTILKLVDYEKRERARAKKLLDYAKPGGVLRASSYDTSLVLMTTSRTVTEALNEAFLQHSEPSATPVDSPCADNCQDPGDEDPGTPDA